MRIKTILLSIVLAHICAANINDTANGIPAGAVVNTTDEAGLTPQTNDTFFVMNDWNSTLDQAELNYSFYFSQSISSGPFSLDSPVVTRFMPSFYILIFLISLPLNVLALVTFTCRIREKKPAVIYMSHLACVDLLFTLLLPLKIHYYLNSSNWVFGEAACRVVTATYYYNMYISILLMMCMSVDRMLAVAFPITSLSWRSGRKASCACMLVWLLALTGIVPLLLRDLTNKNDNGAVTCLDSQNYDQQFLVYMYVFSIFICISFFLPLVVTLVSYFTVIYVLLVKSDNAASSSSSSSSDRRRRAIIMAVAVLTEFVVCFGPTNVILLYFCVYVATGNSEESYSLYFTYMLALCLGSASVFLDPLLYYFGSSQYRQMIRSVLKR